MEVVLKVKRLYKKEKYTIGKMYLNNQYVCDTLEDTDRGLTNDMSIEEIKAKKVYGETAIPTGTYKLIVDWSLKYQKNMPHILDVKGFDGIRIHSGNIAKDSLGCILVGKNREVGKVLDSRNTYNYLMDLIRPYDNIKIVIE